jgi:MscS family membrane protein
VNIDTSNWPDLLQQTGDRFNNWLMLVNLDALLFSGLFIAVVLVFRKIFARWIVGAFQALLKQFSITLSEEVASHLQKVLGILAVTFSVYLVLDVFHPPEVAAVFLRRTLNSIAIIGVFGTWFQLSGPFASMLRENKPSSVNIEVDWVQRIVQVIILLFGITSLLKAWQVDITGALTGVGVLGAGLAIATQDMIRNLVAGMSNISEKRFETGDSVQVEGQFLGTVKRIDLRSTLVVGFDQIPRHIPNSALSDSVVLNLSRRKHRRIMLKVPLVLSSTQGQIEAVRDGLRDYHRSCGDFDLSNDASKYVYVSDLGPSSVDILIYAWTLGPDYDQFLQITERLTLAILGITKSAGTDLAYPTQTIQLDGGSGELTGKPDQTSFQ